MEHKLCLDLVQIFFLTERAKPLTDAQLIKSLSRVGYISIKPWLFRDDNMTMKNSWTSHVNAMR